MTAGGRVSLVTGAASGIGRAVALRLARGGDDVIAVDRDVEGLDAVTSLYQASPSAPGSLYPMVTDLSDLSSAAALVKRSVHGFGRIDALVHCAAIARGGPVLETSIESWQEVLRTNLDSSFVLATEIGRVMRDAGTGGSMVFLTSDRGELGSATQVAYAASKGALLVLVRSLALALGEYQIKVNAINPGTTDTPMARGSLSAEQWASRMREDPLGRVSLPEEVAEVVEFVSRHATYMTGQTIRLRLRKH